MCTCACGLCDPFGARPPGRAHRSGADPGGPLTGPRQQPAPESGDVGWWDAIFAWADANAALFGWLFVGSIVSLVLCALLLPVIVVRLPADYFAVSREHLPRPRTAIGWTWRVVRNVLGVLFVIAGLAMLVLPGQGVLTVLIGVLLLDFPGKRGIERRLICRPKILRLLNNLRTKRGRPPLTLD